MVHVYLSNACRNTSPIACEFSTMPSSFNTYDTTGQWEDQRSCPTPRMAAASTTRTPTPQKKNPMRRVCRVRLLVKLPWPLYTLMDSRHINSAHDTSCTIQSGHHHGHSILTKGDIARGPSNVHNVDALPCSPNLMHNIISSRAKTAVFFYIISTFLSLPFFSCCGFGGRRRRCRDSRHKNNSLSKLDLIGFADWWTYLRK